MPETKPTPAFFCQIFLVLIFTLLILGSAQGARAQSTEPSWSVRDIVRSVEPAIVWVVAERDAGEVSQGTGCIIREDGFLITNAHVVEGATTIIIGWPNRFSRSQLDAEVVTMDTDRDIALLKVNAGHLPVVPVDLCQKPCVGDAVITLGYPVGEELGLDNLTVTRGLLSSVRIGRLTGETLYQTDATITLGCSGGPLYDLDTCSVIGIIQGKGLSLLEGFNFAIPIERLSEFAGTPSESGLESAVGALAGENPGDDSEPSERALDSYSRALEARDGESWAEALSHFKAAWRMDGEDPQAAYGAAESYAALHQPKQALRWLERAFELGYSDFEGALDAPGFEEVRTDPRFVDLVQSF